MILKKRYKFRLYPKKYHRILFAQFAGATRWVFNRGLNSRKESWEKDKKPISCFDQNKELKVLKNKSETEWLKEVHSQVLQQSLHDLDLAYKNFFLRI